MQFINIGFGNLVSVQRLIAVVSPDSAPVKRLVQESRDRGMLIDATYGRKTASVLIMDSDHVVLLDDETKEICKEIVRCGGLDGRVNIALDYFDASINRISAWTVGFRNVQKALLSALLTPNDALRALQDEQRFTELMVRQEALKTMPFGDVWDEYCRSCNVPVGTDWFETVQKYEHDVLSKRV